MKASRDFQSARTRWLPLLGLFGLLFVTAPALSAQSAIAITVEDTHGNSVPNVKVIGRRVEKKGGEDEMLVGEVLSPSKNEGKTYTISGLPAGKYKFFACDPDLKFEPDYKEVKVGDKESKKLPLILQEQLTSQPVMDVKPGNQVCLVHEETGCSAIKIVDQSGAISYAGVRSHYHVEDADACKKN